MPRDPVKSKARKQRYLNKLKVAKHGAESIGKDLRGKHGNHAKGKANGRWNGGRMLSSHGYVLVRVGISHPLAFGNGYAYEHDLVWLTAHPGMECIPDGYDVHHKVENKQDNRIENLELKTSSDHMKEHNATRPRGDNGRFLGSEISEWPEDLRVREFPHAATRA